MDNEPTQNVLALLQKRKDLLDSILLMTQVIDLSEGAESSADYIETIEKRQGLLDIIEAINSDLSQAKLDSPPLSDDVKFQEKAQRIFKESKEVAGHIVDLDKLNMPTIESITDEIKKNLRGIKAGKTVNTHYTYGSDSGGNYFDKSK